MDVYLDCRQGMNATAALGALADLAVTFTPVETALAHVGLACHMDVALQTGCLGPGRRWTLRWQSAARPPDDAGELCRFLMALPLPHPVRKTAVDILTALTDSRHGACGLAGSPAFPPKEAGEEAVLALAVSHGIAQLGVDRILASPLPWAPDPAMFSNAASPPLPDPTVARLLLDKPLMPPHAGGGPLSPLGAALLHVLASDFVPGPVGTLMGLGVGYDAPPWDCAVRALLLQTWEKAADHAAGGCEPVVQVETHMDHLNGEDIGLALTALMAMPEVLDVLWLPGIGKKNRPAGLLRVLCLPPQQAVVTQAVFRHTHTLGLRIQLLERQVLPRSSTRLAYATTSLRAKRYVVDGKAYIRPEADDLADAARRHGIGAPAVRHEVARPQRRRVRRAPRRLRPSFLLLR